jgi:deazaflavin-dependent oxidoreductase (nitroreductase family)
MAGGGPKEQAVPDAGPSHDEDGGQRRPDDQARSAGQVHPAGHGPARPVREYRKSRGDRAGNAIFSVLARAGIGPAHLLTTRGRMTGRLRTIPVILVMQGQQRWLVAPYGAVPWVLNARAAGQVRLRRGRDRHDYTLRQLPAAQAGPILQRYLRIAPAARPYFQASKDSPVGDFIAEADRHPVFALTPISEASAGDTAHASRP